MKFILGLLPLLLAAQISIADDLRVACIGDSITQGEKGKSYPDNLSKILGKNFEVKNFGRSSCCALKSGDYSYWTAKECKAALAFKPDIAVFLFGTNDSKTNNWKGSASFIEDYQELVNSFKEVNPSLKIFLCLPPPAFSSKWGIDEKVMASEQVPAVRGLAKSLGAEIIDLRSPFMSRPELFKDTIHPTGEGYGILANAVRAIKPDIPRISLKPGGKPVRIELKPNNGLAFPLQQTLADVSISPGGDLRFDFEVHDKHDIPRGSKRDDNIYSGGDIVAVYLQPDPQSGIYYEFEINSKGMIFDAKVKNEGGRISPNIKFDFPLRTTPAIVFDAGGGLWKVSFTLPSSSWLEDGNLPGEIRFNIYRIDFDKDGRRNLYAWSPTGCGTFHRPDCFGRLKLTGN